MCIAVSRAPPSSHNGQLIEMKTLINENIIVEYYLRNLNPVFTRKLQIYYFFSKATIHRIMPELLYSKSPPSHGLLGLYSFRSHVVCITCPQIWLEDGEPNFSEEKKLNLFSMLTTSGS